MAKSIKHQLIRDTDGTGPTNFGEVSVYCIDGILFVAESFYESFFASAGATPIAVDEIPAFLPQLTLRVDISVYKEIWIYPVERQQVRRLAEKLSAADKRVKVTAFARNLATYVDGKLVGGLRSLSEFYRDLTEKDIEAARF